MDTGNAMGETPVRIEALSAQERLISWSGSGTA